MPEKDEVVCPIGGCGNNGEILTLEKLKIDERLRSLEISSAGKVEILKRIDGTLTELVANVKIQNGRVNKLENKWHTVLGICTGVGFIVGTIITAVKLLK